MNCPICNQELPEGAKFCHKCRNQIVCQECGKALLKDASICVFCGSEIHTNNHSESIFNKVEFSEDANGRRFKAVFTDTTACNIVDVISPFIPTNKKVLISEHTEENDNNTDIIAIDTIHAENPECEQPKQNTSSLLEKIFQIRDEQILLHEKRLKAQSKADYAGRLTLLFLLYKYNSGEKYIDRDILNSFISAQHLYDGNYRKWLSRNKAMIDISNGKCSLCQAGIEKAEEYLSEVFDDNLTCKWTPGKSSSTSNSNINKANSKRVYNIVKDLNLSPKDKLSLKNFIAKYNPSNGMDYNVYFIYYMQKILLLENITPDYIYSCYKDLGVKFPTNIYQNIADTSKRKAWIDSSDMNNITITTVGENKVEQY